MTLRVQNNPLTDYPVETSNTSDKSKTPATVTTTIRRNETPFSDEHFALMQAAKRAGLPPSQQKAFADANTDGIMFWEKDRDPTPNDDRQVRQADYRNLTGKPTIYKLSTTQIADLENRVADYVAHGGKLRSNKEIPENPANRVNARNGIAPPNPASVGQIDAISTSFGTMPTTQFSVVLSNNAKPVTNERILAQFAEDRYRGGNLWGENFIEIANLSAAQGAKAKNITVKPMGNKLAVYFEVPVEDQIKIHENYKIIQERVNAVEEIVNQTIDKMALNQFLKGIFEGAWENLKANWKTIAHPLETLQGIIQAVKVLANLSTEDLSKIVEHLKQSGYDLVFKEDVSEVSNKAGKLVGAIAVEIILGKGLGLALRGLKGVKAIESLVNKADDLAKVTKLKIIEAFSDEAAKAASLRAKRKLATQLYAGIPADALADIAIVAGNKLKNGIKNFSEFQKQMIAEFGEKIKPELRKLYDKTVDSVYGNRRNINTHELLGGHTIEKHVGKTEKWLRDRLIAEPDIAYASTFFDKELANKAQMETIKKFGAEFDDWAKNSTSSKPIKRIIDLNEPAGMVVGREKFGVKISNKVETYIVKDSTERGWHIVSSYPIP